MPSSTPALPSRPEIGLTGATYLQIGLEALRDGDQIRAVGALASIDSSSWEAITARFPTLSSLITNMETAR